MAIEIVDWPIENSGSFNSYVSLPEDILKAKNMVGLSQFRDSAVKARSGSAFRFLERPSTKGLLSSKLAYSPLIKHGVLEHGP